MIDCTVFEDENGKELTDYELIEGDKYPTLDLDDDTMIDYDEIDFGDEDEDPENVGIVFVMSAGK